MNETDKINAMDFSSAGAEQRIMGAAGEIFAARGFQNATVREICKKADVNIAAINYYFRDKEHLYLAALRYWRDVSFRKYPPGLNVKTTDSPEERLKAFIYSFVFRVLEDGPTSWFGKLVAREYVQPTKALDVLIEETIRPVFELLASIVRDLLKNNADSEKVQFFCASIVSQFLYFLYARPVIKRLFNKDSFDEEEIKKIAEHVTIFSLNAIKGIAEKSQS